MYKAIKNFSCSVGSFKIGDELKDEQFKEYKEELKHLLDHGLMKSVKELKKEAEVVADKIVNPGKKSKKSKEE